MNVCDTRSVVSFVLYGETAALSISDSIYSLSNLVRPAPDIHLSAEIFQQTQAGFLKRFCLSVIKRTEQGH